MALAGGAWMIVTSGLNVMVQASAPKWVKARALATYLLVFQGTLAASSLLWGFVAERIGDPLTLAAAAAGLLVGLAATWRWRLDGTEHADTTPLHLLPNPEIEETPDLEEGPVLVTAEYRVQPSDAGEFVLAMRELCRVRLRDGAMRWGLFRDPSEPGRYLESFVVESWAEHLRQIERATVADRTIDERARSFLIQGDQPTVTHLVGARAPGDTGPIISGM
jgi:transmembrane secretion effector